MKKNDKNFRKLVALAVLTGGVYCGSPAWAADLIPTDAFDNDVIVTADGYVINGGLKTSESGEWNNVYGSKNENSAPVDPDDPPADASDNVLSLYGGNFRSATIYGGHSQNGNTSFNKVVMYDGNYSSANIYGGWSENGLATANTIVINGGTFGGTICGGYSSSGTNVNSNTVEVNGGDLTNAKLKGGACDTGTVTNNVLVVGKKNLQVESVSDFITYRFNVPADVGTDSMLVTTDTSVSVALLDADVIVDIGAWTALPVDTITLVNSAAGFDTTDAGDIGYTEIRKGNNIYSGSFAIAGGSNNLLQVTVGNSYTRCIDVIPDGLTGNTVVVNGDTAGTIGGTAVPFYDDGGATNWDSVYGGYSTAVGANVVNNSIVVTGGIVGTNVYGGYSGNGEANHNKVTVSGGTVGQEVFGGAGATGASYNEVHVSEGATDNPVNVDFSSVHAVYGGHAENLGADAKYNMVVYNNTNTSSAPDVYGGRSEVGSASNNTVTIKDGILEDAYGGYVCYAAGGDVKNNILNITGYNSTGADVVIDDFMGGYSSGDKDRYIATGTAEISNNIVNVGMGNGAAINIKIARESHGGIIGGSCNRENSTIKDNVVNIGRGNIVLAGTTYTEFEGIYGATVFGTTATCKLVNNKVNVSGGSISISSDPITYQVEAFKGLFGAGVLNITGAGACMTGNEVNISGGNHNLMDGTTDLGFGFIGSGGIMGGGVVVGTVGGTTDELGNKVNITGGTLKAQQIFGGYTLANVDADTGFKALHNAVTVSGGATDLTAGQIIGGQGGGGAEYNKVIVQADAGIVNVAGWNGIAVAGGLVGDSVPSSNIDPSSPITTHSGNANNNSVTIAKGTYSSGVYGGYTGGYSSRADDNTLVITGGTFSGAVTIAGGMAFHKHHNGGADIGADGNALRITGGTVNVTTIAGGVVGATDGYDCSTNGSSSNNTVEISGTAQVTVTNLLGGVEVSGIDAFSNPTTYSQDGTGNALILGKKGVSATNVAGFQRYTFSIPDNIATDGSEAMLTTGSELVIADTDVIRVDLANLSAELTGSNVITLIDTGAAGFGTTDISAVTDKKVVKGRNEYAGTFAINGNKLQLGNISATKYVEIIPDAITGNKVVVTGGTTGTIGGTATPSFNNGGDGTITNWVNVYGGYSKATGVKIKNNIVAVNPGAMISENVYGGYAGDGSVTDNTVSINGGDIKGNIYGGYSDNGDSKDNTVIINGGTFAPMTELHGGVAGEGKESSGNKLVVGTKNVEVKSVSDFQKYEFNLDGLTADSIVLSVDDAVVQNSGDIYAVNFENFAPGSTITLIKESAGTFNLEGMVFMVNGVTLADDKVADYFSLSSTSDSLLFTNLIMDVTVKPDLNTNGNKVEIIGDREAKINDKIVENVPGEDAAWKDVYGGHSDNSESTGNEVVILGGSINGNIYGGYSDRGDSKDNTVIINGGSFAPTTELHGGVAGEGRESSGNKLVVGTKNVEVKSVSDFQKYTFDVPTDIAVDGSEAMLKLNGEDLKIEKEDIIDVNTDAVQLSNDDKITLIKMVGEGAIDNISRTKEYTDGFINVKETVNAGDETEEGSGKYKELTFNKSTFLNDVGSKAPVEGMAAAALAVNSSMDLLMGAGVNNLITSTGTVSGTEVFAAANYGKTINKTGSSVDMSGYGIVVGVGRKVFDKNGNKTTGGLFFEYGNGDFDTYNTGYNGSGKNVHKGGGYLMRWDNKSGNYYEGMIHVGKVSTNWSNAFGGYSADPTYYGGALTYGHKFMVGDNKQFSVYGSYIYGRTGSVDTKVNNYNYNFEATKSHRTKLGLRYALSDLMDTMKVRPYIGLAWEHEFNGETAAFMSAVNGNFNSNVLAPSMKGDSGIFELGCNMEVGKWTLGIGAEVLVGHRHGWNGNLKVVYNF